MATRMIQRRGTAAEWTAANPVLAAGEIGFETDTTKFKFGDGTTAWADIAYFASADQLIDGAPELLDTLNEIAAAINDDPDFFNTLTSRTLDDLPDVSITSVSDSDVLTYNATAGEWINLPGIPLDENLDIPLSYLTELSDDVDVRIAGFGTTTVQTEAEWTADTNVPALGSLNISTGDSIRAKIGDGVNVFDSLEYVPNNTYVAAQITTALSTYATKADPTFSGTVSLPSTTSIGDVDATEIAHLDGVTSGIQGQLDSLDTLKAPIADPTFTGTVSGVTASMVGLGNVDNTADADKPVSTATQAALDLKANLSGATFGGSVVIEGDLTVSGATTTVYASDLSVRDNMIYLNQGGYFTVTAATGDGTNVTYTTDADHSASVGEYITVTGADPATFDISGEGAEITAVTSNTITVASAVTDTFVSGGTLRVKSHANPDLGWAAGRYDVVNGSGYAHAGIFRDATDGVFKFFDGYVPEPDESVFIDTTDASFALAPLAVEKVVFADGTEQSAAGVPSITGFTQVDDEVQVATITNVVGDGNLATITTSADHGFSESDTVVIADVVDVSYNGTYTIASTPTSTTFTVESGSAELFQSGGTATVTTPGNYILDTLDHQDNIVEMNSSSAVTFTIPTDAALAWPVGASMDIFAAGTGEVTIAGDDGVTVNATPGLILRTQWSSATILKRGANNWVVYGDLKA